MRRVAAVERFKSSSDRAVAAADHRRREGRSRPLRLPVSALVRSQAVVRLVGHGSSEAVGLSERDEAAPASFLLKDTSAVQMTLGLPSLTHAQSQ